MEETSPTITPGRVLRVWRSYAGLTASDLAAALGVQPSTVTMWETDQRSIRAVERDTDEEDITAGKRETTIHTVAAALGLDADHKIAMVGMWMAAASPNVMPARPKWFHNFQEPAGPVWVWLRGNPDDGDQRVVLEFGPFDRKLPLSPQSGGILVHSPTSVANPPLTALFGYSGWMDCSRGVVPPEVTDALDIITADVTGLIGRHAPHSEPLADAEEAKIRIEFGLLRRAVSQWFKLPWELLKPHFWPLRPEANAPHALDGQQVVATNRPENAVTDQHGALISQPMMNPEQIEAIRSARGLTRAAAAAEATKLNPDHPMTDRMIEHLEKDGRVPTAPQALSRLDMVYQTDGRLGIDRVYDTLPVSPDAHGTYTVTFPQFWVGHVWLQPRGPQPNDSCTIELVWYPWRRTQRLQSGTVITTRKATNTSEGSKLHVTLPAGWDFTAGLGVVPAALDINVGWRPVSFRAAAHLLVTSLKTIRESVPARRPHRRKGEQPKRLRRPRQGRSTGD